MKQLIIFIALMLLFVTGIIYQSDYSKVENAEKALKTKIEDSASGAVLCIDEAAYAEGYIKFNDDNVIEYVQNTMPKDCDVTITIFDETMRTYDKDGAIIGNAVSISYPYTHMENGHSFAVVCPSVQLTAVKKTHDIYRLPFLEKTETIRSTMYSWEGR